MKIMDFLKKKAVTADLKSKDKKSAVKELVELLSKAGAIKPKEKESLVKTIMEREALGSTGIGQNIGIPHGKSPNVKELVAAFGLSKQGVNFESLDGEPTHIFFLLIAPEESAGPHLKALARISRLLKDKYFRDMLKDAKDEKELIKILGDEDNKRQ
ncbi:MAG: PTS sugar transporter subunit IIA [Candidatus Omnitrophica bacterium]|nr:PTS sugar transporter subunit IIA [Candidatus Omnitrophota bacterium]